MDCQQNVLDSEYFQKMWLTFVREWVRATIGPDALQDLDTRLKSGEQVSVPRDTDMEIQNVIIAMSEKNAIPGVWTDQDGKCYQDWTQTACFARWYMLLVPESKTKVQDMIKSGNASPWTEFHGASGTVAPCPAGKLADASCCPSSVWADPAYLTMDEQQPSGWKWWQIAIGAVGLGLTAAFVRSKIR